jgi:hypothetical protein
VHSSFHAILPDAAERVPEADLYSFTLIEAAPPDQHKVRRICQDWLAAEGEKATCFVAAATREDPSTVMAIQGISEDHLNVLDFGAVSTVCILALG